LLAVGIAEQGHAAGVAECFPRLEAIAIVAEAAPVHQRVLQAHVVVGFCSEPGIEPQAVAGEESEGHTVDESAEAEWFEPGIVERWISGFSPADEIDAHVSREIHRGLDDGADVGGIFAFRRFAALGKRQDDAFEIVIEERDVAIGHSVEYPVELCGFADDRIRMRQDSRPHAAAECGFTREPWQVFFQSAFVRLSLAFRDANQRSRGEQVRCHAFRPRHRGYDDLRGVPR
jgi:hypothetical protein